MQRGRDPVCVPNTVREICLTIRFDRKLRRNSRKRRSHSNSSRIARLGKKKSLRVQTAEGTEHFRFVDLDLARDFGRIWNATGFRGGLVDRELNSWLQAQLRHGRSLAPFKILNSFLVFL